jgi:hypothetical protein
MKKIVIYKASGGLIQMLYGLVYCIDYCINNNHVLLIDCINHEYFSYNLSDFFIINNFNDYSENYNIIPKELTHYKGIPIDFISKNNPIYNMIGGFWYNYVNVNVILENIDFDLPLKIYTGFGTKSNSMIAKYIRVKPNVINLCKYEIQFKKTIIEPYIGIHFRNTDRKHDINEYIIPQYKDNIIYLATDDINSYKKLKLFYTNIIQYTIPIDSMGEGIHKFNTNKYEVIMNILIDLYMLLDYNCVVFIPSTLSFVSQFIQYMKTNKLTIFE